MTVTAVTETIQSLSQVESLFDLNRATDLDFFPEWRENLPELSEREKSTLDRIKTSYLYNSADGSLTESTINLLLVSPLLYLAGLCDPPFKVQGEKAVEFVAEEENKTLRGRIDALVLQRRIWLILVESRQAKFSFSMALPQALTYMMGSPNEREPLFGLVTNGDGFLFIKLVKQPQPFYALAVMKKRIYSSIFIAFLGFALSLALSYSRAVEAEDVSLRDRGLQFYQSEQYARAAEVWQEAIAISPEDNPRENALLYANLSLAYQRLGRWDEAQQALDNSFALLDSLAPTDWLVRAKGLNALGRLQWVRGQPQKALETWKQAQKAYAEARDLEGAIGTQLNQAKALQALGWSFEANRTLEKLYEQLQQQPPTRATMRTYLALGMTRRRLGELEEARKVLEEGLKLAQRLNLETLPDELELELGNTARSQANQQIAIGRQKEAETSLQKAFKYYQEVAAPKNPACRDTGSCAIAQLQANLNQLNFAADIGKNPNTDLFPKIEALFDQLPLNRTTLEARLNYARSLTCWQVKVDADIPSCTRSEWRDYDGNNEKQTPIVIPSQLDQISQLLVTSIQASEKLEDWRLKASAMGQLGALYEQNKQWQEAESLTRKVIDVAAAMEADEIEYRFQWQLGRLLKKQARPEAAIEAYGKAIESLGKVRHHLLRINTNVQFSFRDNVEPVYREYIDLLLEVDEGAKPDEKALEKATKAIDNLQLAEIENFLRCDLSPNVKRAEEGKISNPDPNTAIIYPIVTRRGLAIIFKLGEKSLDYKLSEVDPRDLKATLTELREFLADKGGGYKKEIIERSGNVYDWLFRPLKAVLKENRNIETLVFVLDEPLRNIPMGVLYDREEEEYLMQKEYALAVMPSLKLFPPQRIERSLRFASGGVGIRQEPSDFDFSEIKSFEEEFELTFPKIEELEEELAKIPDPNFRLVDEEFTTENIETQLQSHDISAIHWKTHGVFSSVPEQTYLVAYKEIFQVLDLNQFIQISSKNETLPLELLVLRACSSAEGDKRAVLGMAGVAARAGAKTTLSTLWRAEDSANTRLMEKFYNYLLRPEMMKAQESYCARPEMTKARALHCAQQELFYEYSQAPHTWATYILVGNWR